jgi:putative transposase
MSDSRSLAHSRRECKYHVVWIPKYRRKALYGKVRAYLGEIIRELARERESNVVEGHLCLDHIHMLIEIPPKYAVAQAVGYIKGKSAIAIARRFTGRERNFTGQSFWARGCYVSTVGRDEEAIKKYIREQEAEDKRLDQLEMFHDQQ